jgi:hypothetical protein
MATGIVSPRAAISRQCAAPTLCRCQCIANRSIQYLHAVHPDVSRAGLGIARYHLRERDIRTAVLGPTGCNRKTGEIDVAPALDDLLTRRASRHRTRRVLGDLPQLGEHGQLLTPTLRHLELDQFLDPPADIVEIVHAQRQRDAPQ